MSSSTDTDRGFGAEGWGAGADAAGAEEGAFDCWAGVDGAVDRDGAERWAVSVPPLPPLPPAL